MNALNDDVLQASLVEVLESMCFVFADGEAPPAIPDQDQLLERTLRFTGPVTGSFGLRAPRSVTTMLAANFLGQDEEETTDADAADVLAELANIVCGNLLGSVSSEQAFQLTSPQQPDTPLDCAGVWFRWGEGCVNAWVETR